MKEALSYSCYISFASDCRILKDGKNKFSCVKEKCSIFIVLEYARVASSIYSSKSCWLHEVIGKYYYLGIPLYDYSGMKLDTNSYQLLDYCGNQLHHLTTLFQGVLKICKNPSVQGSKL